MIECDKNVINCKKSCKYETDMCSSKIAEPLRKVDRSICFKPRLKAGSDGDDLKTPGNAFQASTLLKKREDRCLFEALAGFCR